MQQTTNYQLNKPEASDYADIAPISENMDTIDAQLKAAQNHREDGDVHVTSTDKQNWNNKAPGSLSETVSSLSDALDSLGSAVSGHTGNSTIHVTGSDKAKWNGYSTIHGLSYSKSDTTHALTGLSGVSGTVSCVFTATAAYSAGDTITVDGTAYTIQLSNGEAAEDNLFVSGASVPVVIDTAGKKVNFKAAGASRKFASGSISGIYGGGTSTITLGWEPKYIFCICNQTGRMEPENLTASALAYIDGLVTGFAESDNTPDGAAYIDSSLNVIQTTKTGFTVNNIPVRLWGNENSYFFPYSRETFYWAFD